MGRLRASRFGEPGLSDGAFQRFSGGEAHHAALGNLDGVARPRILRDTRPPLGRFEGAKPHECNRIALFQCPRDAIEQRIKGRPCARFGGTCLLGDLRNQIVFIHLRSFLGAELFDRALKDGIGRRRSPEITFRLINGHIGIETLRLKLSASGREIPR